MSHSIISTVIYMSFVLYIKWGQSVQRIISSLTIFKLQKFYHGTLCFIFTLEDLTLACLNFHLNVITSEFMIIIYSNADANMVILMVSDEITIEWRCLATIQNNHLATEESKKVCWLLALHHPHLHCCTTQLIIQFYCLECSSTLLILRWVLALETTQYYSSFLIS